MWTRVVNISRSSVSCCKCSNYSTANNAFEGIAAKEKNFPETPFFNNFVKRDDRSRFFEENAGCNAGAKGNVSTNAETKQSDGISVSPECSVSRYDIYRQDSLIKEAKTIGVGIGDVKVENFIIDQIQKHSVAKHSLHDLNVALFNMHTTNIAQRLIDLDIGGLSLVEASQHYAQQVKKYVKTKGWLKNRNVQAYRATFESLFPSGKKFGTPLPVKLLFGDKTLAVNGLNPLVLKKANAGNESGSNARSSPLIVGIFPVQLQQSQMIQVLLRSLIIHLCNYSSNTLFQYGPVEVLTFLCPNNYATLLSGKERCFDFVSNFHRYQSWLFNRLYDVKRLRPFEGFPCSSFSPPVPPQKSVTYEKKLSFLELRNGCMYPVAIKPKTEVKIGTYNLVSNIDDGLDADISSTVAPSEFLPHYSFWTHLIGKLSAKTRLQNRLIQWFPNLKDELKANVSPYGTVVEFDYAQLDNIFCIVRKELLRHQTLSKALEMHLATYKISAKANESFAD